MDRFIDVKGIERKLKTITETPHNYEVQTEDSRLIKSRWRFLVILLRTVAKKLLSLQRLRIENATKTRQDTTLNTTQIEGNREDMHPKHQQSNKHRMDEDGFAEDTPCSVNVAPSPNNAAA